MKNIHILPTDKPSRIYLNTGEWFFENDYSLSVDECINQNIYITSDEEIKDGDYYLYLKDNSVHKLIYKHHIKLLRLDIQKKIILTTDQDLVKDGIQAIDDEFLEWFVKNPNCEGVEVEKQERFRFEHRCDDGINVGYSDNITQYHSYKETSIKNWDKLEKELMYKIIIPKEEPFKHEMHVLSKEEVLANRSNAYEFIDFDKQETLEEAAEKYTEFWLQNKGLLIADAFNAGVKWQQEQIGKSEFLQKLRATKSDAEARRLIFEQFKKK